MRRITSALVSAIAIPISFCFFLLTPFFSFKGVSELISTIPSRPGNQIRYWFYKLTLKKVGENVTISYGCIFTSKEISIGDSVRFGPYNTIANANFGSNIITAQFVHFLSGSKHHGYQRVDLPMMQQPGKLTTISIGNDIWIGANTVIMSDVKDGTIIGSGSVVTKTFQDFDIVAGNPAKVLKSRLEESRKNEI